VTTWSGEDGRDAEDDGRTRQPRAHGVQRSAVVHDGPAPRRDGDDAGEHGHRERDDPEDPSGAGLDASGQHTFTREDLDAGARGGAAPAIDLDHQ
jgi:hypothetical protein